jgi:glutamine synthetase
MPINAYMGEDELPLTLGDAVDLLDEDEALREVLGEEFVDLYAP